jgi:hypothetical protein
MCEDSSVKDNVQPIAGVGRRPDQIPRRPLRPPASRIQKAKGEVAAVDRGAHRCVVAGTLFWQWLTPEPLTSNRRPLMPQPLIANGTVSLIVPGYQVIAELASYQDELFAYLMFDHLRHSSGSARRACY